MSDALDLTFLPWLRRGLARSITGGATLDATLDLSGTPLRRSITLLGPGSVIGLSAGEVIATHPTAGSREVSPLEFAAVELATPDLPWMFTPEPKGDKLPPWLMLVVVERREGIELDRSTQPLPRLRIDRDAGKQLPDPSEAWMWAHVQITGSLGNDGQLDTKLDALLAAEPERARARLLCPRRLAPNKPWIAALVPRYEAGRLAGLGLAPSEGKALAWSSATDSLELPVYHHFEFATAAGSVDFEELVLRLQPRPLPADAGVATLDIGAPGSAALPTTPGTTTRLLGALISSEAKPKPVPEPLAGALLELVGEGLRAAGVAPAKPPYDPRRDDPIVAPPAWGARTAGLASIPAKGWASELNRDPATRAIAGIGATLVRRDQEDLAAQAWQQLEGLREVNRTLGRTRVAAELGRRLASRLARLDDAALVQISRGAQARLPSGAGSTLRGRVDACVLPRGLISGALRRRLRRGTPLARTTTATPLTARFLREPQAMLSYARPTLPTGIVFDPEGDNDELESVAKQTISSISSKLLASALPKSAIGGKLAVPESMAIASRKLSIMPGSEAPAASSPTPTRTPSKLPALARSGSPIGDLAKQVRDRLDPRPALAKQLRARVRAPVSAWTQALPTRMRGTIALDWPLAERLAAYDRELLMPGAGTLPDESVALACINPSFVEALLIGANHELACELAWRELPCNPRETFVHGFWTRVDADEPDIGEIAGWAPASALGSHTLGLDPARVVVLIVRGELLRRFPDTLIYAVPAKPGAPPREDPAATPILPSLFGSLGPATQYFGFVLPAGADPRGNPGWLFAFEQPPTGPRFGLDADPRKRPSDPLAKPATWSDLSWAHVKDQPHVGASSLVAGSPTSLKFDDLGANQWTETWARNAAAMARICLQRPARVLIHARALLPGGR